MRKLLMMIMIPMLAMLVNSCTLFDGKEKKQMTQEIENQEIEIEKCNEKAQDLDDMLEEVSVSLDACEKSKLPCDCKYYIVVGSFLEKWRAEKWSKYIESLNDPIEDEFEFWNYETYVVVNENKFNCVYIRSSNDLNEALKNLKHARYHITPRAWIHINKNYKE
jgi:hypothetical protein